MDPHMQRPGAFWSSRTIGEQIRKIVSPPPGPEEVIKDASYELRLGPEVYISGSKEKIKLEKGDMVAIAPGQIALLLTEETVKIPPNAIGFISLKTSVKVPGLINVSGFHVDPGFEGRLVFTVYNAGTETYPLVRGQKTFLLWLAYLDEFEKMPRDGGRQGQMDIPPRDISHLTTAGASPAHLSERIGRLEMVWKVYAAVLVAFLIAVITLFLRGAFDSPQSPRSTSQSSPGASLEAPRGASVTAAPPEAQLAAPQDTSPRTLPD